MTTIAAPHLLYAYDMDDYKHNDSSCCLYGRQQDVGGRFENQGAARE